MNATATHKPIRTNTEEITVDATDLRFGDYIPGVGTISNHPAPEMDLGVVVETIAYDPEADRNRFSVDYYDGPQTVIRQTNPNPGWEVPVEFIGDLETYRANQATHNFAYDEDGARCWECDARPGGAYGGWPCGTELPRLGG